MSVLTVSVGLRLGLESDPSYFESKDHCRENEV